MADSPSAPSAASPAPAAAPTPEAGAKPTAAAPAAATEPPAAPVPAAERFNPRTREFAALTRKEREVRGKMAALSEGEAKATAYQQSLTKARENPDEYLRQAGLTYDDVTKYYLNGKAAPPEVQVKTVVERLQKEFEEKLAQRDQAHKQQQDQQVTNRAIQDFVAKIDNVVQTKPEFELTRAYEATGEVYKLIDLHYAKYGELLDIETAAGHIEATLLEQKEGEAKKLLALEKIKSRLAPPAPDPKKGLSKQTSGPTDTGATITNAMTASTPRPSRQPTEDEAWAAIMKRVRTQ